MHLFYRYIEWGYITKEDPLMFFAMAEHCLATANPPESAGNLFASNIQKKRFEKVKKEEKEKAAAPSK